MNLYHAWRAGQDKIPHSVEAASTAAQDTQPTLPTVQATPGLEHEESTDTGALIGCTE